MTGMLDKNAILELLFSALTVFALAGCHPAREWKTGSVGESPKTCFKAIDGATLMSLRSSVGKTVCIEGQLTVDPHGVFFKLPQQDDVIEFNPSGVYLDVSFRGALQRDLQNGGHYRFTGLLSCRDRPPVKCSHFDLATDVQ